LLELVAETLETTLFNAAITLSQGGDEFPAGTLTPETVTQYDQNFLVARDRLDAFWATCQQHLANDHVEVRHILRKFNFRKELRGETWIAHGGRYIGACSALEAVQAFCPKADKTTQHASRVFRGKNWDGVVVIPFHDLPGRICGFLFIGRDGNGSDFVYRNISQAHHRSGGPLETGLAMYDTLWKKTATTVFNNTTFVIDNVLMAMRLQLQHMNDHTLPLPLVATYNVKAKTTRTNRDMQLASEAVWRSQPHRRYIFWSPKLAAATIDMASHVGGKVFVGYADAVPSRLLPVAQLRKVYKKAERWEAALENALTSQSDSGITNTLQHLQMSPATLRTFLLQCPPDLQQRIADCGGTEANCQIEAHHGHQTISESHRGWMFKNSERIVCSAILRIERIIRSKDSDDYYYQGHIIHANQKIPFIELGPKMDKYAMKIMENLVHLHCTVAMESNAYYNKWMVDLAKQFHRPEIVVTTGNIGWDANTAKFALPQFTLGLGGVVESVGMPFTDTQTPALHLESPTVAMRPLTSLMENSEQNQIIWAVAGNVAANVLAPAKNHPTAGIGLIGQGANVVGAQAAIALGCSELSVHARGRPPVEYSQELHTLTSRHNWPVLIRYAKPCTALRLWLLRGENKDVVLRVEAKAKDGLGLQAPWRYIEAHTADYVDPNGLKLAHGIIPHWLRDISHRRLELASDAEIYIFQVMEDIAKWTERLGLSSEVVRDAAKLIEDMGDMPWDRANRLASLLYTAITNGLLTLEQSDFPEKKSRLALVRVVETDKPPGIFVGRNVVQQLLTKQGLGALDVPRTTEMLANAGALVRELEYNGVVGWLLAEPWWQEQVRACRARTQQQLRVVG
jgi:hypothetical protein